MYIVQRYKKRIDKFIIRVMCECVDVSAINLMIRNNYFSQKRRDLQNFNFSLPITTSLIISKFNQLVWCLDPMILTSDFVSFSFIPRWLMKSFNFARSEFSNSIPSLILSEWISRSAWQSSANKWLVMCSNTLRVWLK